MGADAPYTVLARGASDGVRDSLRVELERNSVHVYAIFAIRLDAEGRIARVRWRRAGDTWVGWDGPEAEAGAGDVIAALQAGDVVISLFDVDGQRVQGPGLRCVQDDAGRDMLLDGDGDHPAPFRLINLPHF